MRERLKYWNGEELPADVWEGKYCMKNNGVLLEDTPDDMHRRMAKEFARKDGEYVYKGDEENLSELGKRFVLSLTEDEIFKYFKDFKYIIPQGSVMSILGNKYKIGSLSNCFVIPPPLDSYGGIMKTDQELIQLMKRRAGVGTNLNNLRPISSRVSNAAESSTGTPSFAGRFSNSTREVAQDGRRGALMLMLSCLHPDIFDWVKMKEDLTKVTGANITTMLTNLFMEKAQSDNDFICRFPINISYEELHKMEDFYKLEYNKIKELSKGVFVMKIHAKELFDLIIEMAWKNGEPGLAFMDNIWNYSPDGVYEQFKAIASNPCAEQWLNAYDSCRLMALNLFSIVIRPFRKGAYIDYKRLYEISYIQQRLADVLVDLEIEYVEKIIAKIISDPEPEDIKAVELSLWKNVLKVAKAGRRTGCGFTALADTLAAIGVKYDGEEGITTIKKICRTKMEAELDCTIDLAIMRGSFEGWDKKKEFPYEGGSNEDMGGNTFYTMMLQDFFKQSIRMMKWGRRNVSWSTIAPTGSLSIITKLVENFNASAGVEPQFALWFWRNRKVNANEKDVRVDFTDQNGDSWQQYPVIMGAFRDWYNIYMEGEQDPASIDELTKEEMEYIFTKSPWYKCIANDINWEKRVEIQSVVQRYTTNAISSTVNLPEDVSKEEVANIYWAAWKAGLKGITVYRDNCRTGVLVNKSVGGTFEEHEALKRPESLEASIFHLKVRGIDFTVAVGELNAKPYEIFATEGMKLKGCDRGRINKKGKGRYHFICNDVDEAITEEMTDEQAALTRLASTALRHGANVQFVVEQLNKTHGDMTSFSKALARTLKHYIPDGKKVKAKCPQCQSEEIIYREGCKTCISCGSSQCG